MLERGFTAATQFYAFPEPHWARLRTTNSLERLHTEIKRRIRSAGAFPDRASALRLITAVALRTRPGANVLPGSHASRTEGGRQGSLTILPLTGLDPSGSANALGLIWKGRPLVRNRSRESTATKHPNRTRPRSPRRERSAGTQELRRELLPSTQHTANSSALMFFEADRSPTTPCCPGRRPPRIPRSPRPEECAQDLRIVEIRSPSTQHANPLRDLT